MKQSLHNNQELINTDHLSVCNRLITQIHGSNDPDNEQVKLFIKQQFFKKYNAKINSFMPNLVSIINNKGDLKAAVGYRSAKHHSLFLEQYISSTIEHLLSTQENTPISRSQIVEVGNLACVSPGYARIAIIKLTQLLNSAGYEWVVFTLTKELKNSFNKLNLTPKYLETAKSEKVNTNDYWGSYYSTSPAVMYGNIKTGLLLLQK
jgi:hypothetical protein